MSDCDTIYLDAIEERERAADDAAGLAPGAGFDPDECDEHGNWECPECFNDGTWRGCALCGAVNGED